MQGFRCNLVMRVYSNRRPNVRILFTLLPSFHKSQTDLYFNSPYVAFFIKIYRASQMWIYSKFTNFTYTISRYTKYNRKRNAKQIFCACLLYDNHNCQWLYQQRHRPALSHIYLVSFHGSTSVPVFAVPF
jgi:hypothetical protein